MDDSVVLLCNFGGCFLEGFWLMGALQVERLTPIDGCDVEFMTCFISSILPQLYKALYIPSD